MSFPQLMKNPETDSIFFICEKAAHGFAGIVLIDKSANPHKAGHYSSHWTHKLVVCNTTVTIKNDTC